MRRFLFVSILLAFAIASVALADKTVTTLTAPAVVTRLEFFPPGDGGIMPATVCGRSRFSDGGLTPVTCYDVQNGGLPPGNPLNTSVKTLAEGGARTFWIGQEAL